MKNGRSSSKLANGSLTNLDLRFEFDASEAIRPWTIETDVTGSGWAIQFQNYGGFAVESDGDGCEKLLMVQFCHDARNEDLMDVSVTLSGSFFKVMKQETVRLTELSLATSRIACELLESAK